MDSNQDPYSKALRELPLAIEPLYKMSAPNVEFDLLSGKGTITRSPDNVLSGDFRISYRWLPSPTTVLRMVPETSEQVNNARKLFLMDRGEEPPVLSVEGFKGKCACRISLLGDGAVSGYVNGPYIEEPTGKVSSMLFHVTNWPDVHGKPLRYDGSAGAVAGRIELRFDGWLVILDPVKNHSEVSKASEAVRGYGITHVGKLYRENEDPFEPKDAETIIDGLRWFLAFARGIWCGPLLISWLPESKGDRLRDFSAYHCDTWAADHGWFAHHQAESLQILWPLFCKLWEDKYSRGVLSRAIWWYVGGVKQSGGSDGGLILVQAGLELLAWFNLVVKQKVISRRGFDDLPTADKLRLLIASMKLETGFGPRLKNLESLAKKQKHQWTVAPWAMTEVRNRLTHPKNSEELDGEGPAINDAYWLSLFYLESAILYTCDYKSRYTNRLNATWRGETESAPWT